MFGYLVLLFTILPALELAVLIKVGTHIGVINTLLIIFCTGILGAYLARLQGFLIIREIQFELNRGVMPNAQLLDGFMVMAGGILLLTPGFVTDIFGFLLLIPWTRSLIKRWVSRKLERMLAQGQVMTFHSSSRGHDDYDDIDISSP